jgi:putative ABC transport system substrate-binding protein
MRRRDLLLGVAATASSNVSIFRLRAKAAANVLHIAAVLMSPPTAWYWLAFMKRLRELGYREGENLLVAAFDGNEDVDYLVDKLKDEIAKGANVVVASGPEVTLKWAVAATKTVPIVMLAFDYDPIALGYITNVSRPTGNVTGLFVRQVELAVKRLEIIREAFPNAKEAVVPWDKLSADQWLAVQDTAKSIGIRVIGIELREQPYDYERAFADASVWSTDLLVPMASPLIYMHRKNLIGYALKHQMAAIIAIREVVDEGLLMSYGVTVEGTMRRVAEYVDRIAKGAKPGDLPVEQPTKFELVISLKAAKALGLTIPPSLLAQADEVIE